MLYVVLLPLVKSSSQSAVREIHVFIQQIFIENRYMVIYKRQIKKYLFIARHHS